MKGKKGLSRNAIVGLVIALLILVVLGVFFYNIYYAAPTLINKETCRMSVISRANWVAQQLPSDIRPSLQCKTQQIPVKTKDEQAITKEIANAMYDCWDMLGGGKIDFLGSSPLDFNTQEYGLVTAKSDCLICSIIRFDDNLKANPKTLDIPAYLEKTKIPRKEITYLEYFTEEEGASLPVGAQTEKIQTDQDVAVIYFTFESKNFADVLKKDFATIVGVLIGTKLLVPGGSTILKYTGRGLLSVVKSPYGAAITVAVIGGFLGWQGWITFQNQKFATGYCDDQKQGCTQVMLVTYDAQSLNMCDQLHSIP